MAKLSDVFAYLENLKQNGEIIDYSIVQDVGNKVVINVINKLSDEEYESENYVLLVKDRGTDKETVYWNRRKFRKILEEQHFRKILEEQHSASENIPQTLLQNIESDLTNRYKVRLFENIQLDEQKNIVRVDAYCETKQNVLTLKQFIVKINTDGTYAIYEVERPYNL